MGVLSYVYHGSLPISLLVVNVRPPKSKHSAPCIVPWVHATCGTCFEELAGRVLLYCLALLAVGARMAMTMVSARVCQVSGTRSPKF